MARARRADLTVTGLCDPSIPGQRAVLLRELQRGVVGARTAGNLLHGLGRWTGP